MDVIRKSHEWNARLAGLVYILGMCWRLGVRYTPLGGENSEVLPRALTIITAPLPGPTDHWHPIWVYGTTWLITGFVALFTFRRPMLHNFVYIAVIVGLSYWALAYYVAWGWGGDSQAWFTATGYTLFAFITYIIGYRTRPQRKSEAVTPHE